MNVLINMKKKIVNNYKHKKYLVPLEVNANFK